MPAHAVADGVARSGSMVDAKRAAGRGAGAMSGAVSCRSTRAGGVGWTSPKPSGVVGSGVAPRGPSVVVVGGRRVVLVVLPWWSSCRGRRLVVDVVVAVAGVVTATPLPPHAARTQQRGEEPPVQPVRTLASSRAARSRAPASDLVPPDRHAALDLGAQALDDGR